MSRNTHLQVPSKRTDWFEAILGHYEMQADKEVYAPVYELYGLTEEDIAIVEGRVSGPRSPSRGRWCEPLRPRCWSALAPITRA